MTDESNGGVAKADPDKPSLRSIVLTYALPAAIGLIGVVAGSWLTYLQNLHQQQADFRVKFEAAIRDVAPQLSDSKTAVPLYTALYALAPDGDKSDKRLLMIIGYSSSSSDVKSVLTELMQSDPDMTALAKEKEMVALAQNSATDSASAKAAAQATSSGKSTVADDTARKEKVDPDAGQVALLTAAVPKSAKTGWVYFGRLGTAGSGAGECVDPKASVPAAGSKVALCGSRYVRDEPSAIDGHVVTAVSAGTIVTVLSTRSFPLAAHANAVWLNVSLK